MSETQLSTDVQAAAKRLGLWCLRINSGGRIRRIRLAPSGTPDLYFIGLNFWMELKRDKEKPSKAQLKWHARAEREGVRVYVVRSLPEAVRVMTAELEAFNHERANGWVVGSTSR